MRRWALRAALLAALTAATPAHAQPSVNEALHRALVAALRPALPFPEAGADGTPISGPTDAAWTVRWPGAGEARVEVLANPLNAENRERALAAEKAIQQAAMKSQRRSQGDYDQAVSDFARTGRVSRIREISLGDEGVAGERYDAESHLAIAVAPLDDPLSFTVATSIAPEVVPGMAGPAMVLRVPANVYKAPAEAGVPPDEHYCAEQAWVVFGASGPPTVVRREDGPQVEVTVPVAGASGGPRRGVVVTMSGNPALLDQALRDADWSALRTLIGG